MPIFLHVQRGRVQARLAAAALLSLLSIITVAPRAAAANVTDAPRLGWGVFKACSSSQPNKNCATVRAIRAVRGVVYVGGDFTHVTTADGSTRIPRQNLAAFVAATGEPLAGFNPPSFNGWVYSIETDGATVWAGGSFSQAGCPQTGCAPRVAAFDADTGVRLPFNARVGPGTVYALLLDGDKLYVGGRFSAVRGQPRNAAAAVHAVTGALLTWNPNVQMPDAATDPKHNKVPVRALARHDSGVYVVGDFDTINGVPDRGVIRRVDPASGALDESFQPQINNELQGFDVAFADTPGREGMVLAAGGQNRIFRLDLSGTVRWSRTTSGDNQGVAIIGDVVYIGGHFDCVDTCYPEPNPNGTFRSFLAAFQYADGAVDPWRPDLGPPKAPWLMGVWAVEADDAFLYAGGVFNCALACRDANRDGKADYPTPKLAAFPRI